jgi:hypothetical protein
VSARIAVLGISLASIFIAGCASVRGSGSKQSIKVDTIDARGASLRDAACVLSNDKGSWKISTPEAAEVTRSNNALTVKCSKQGHPDGNAVVNSSTRDEMYGNLIVGGLVGIAIDHSTGAGYEYPTYVAVRMGDLVTASLAKPTGRRAQHERDLPPASGYADVANVDAVPYLSDRGRELYRQSLARPAPKAFALSAQGAVAFWANSPRAVGKAIENCDKYGRGQCTLYAYDDTVVWVKPADMPLASAGTKKPAAVTVSPPKQHAWAIPAASGFAKLTDAGSIPFVRDTGRTGYSEFLRGASPRAFAISNSGHWAWRSNNENAIAQALEHCRELSKRECWLYAVDESVVWIPDPELRAGLAMPRPAE